MTVADRLGKGSSFGTVRNHRLSDRGRAKAIAEGAIPEYELVRLQLTDVAPSPLNPRRNFGTDEQKTTFGEGLRKAQLQPCTAVSRAVYLGLWPDHEDRIGDADYVLVNGERRYRSAVHVGLESLDFVVRDELASSREEFVDNILKENLDRADFDVIERARGVAQLVEACASNQAAAAARLDKDRSWVGNQLILLTLPEEIQAMLSAGMPERDGRRMARQYKDNSHLSPTELLDWLQAEKDQERQSRQAEKELVRRAREEQVLSADNTAPSATDAVSSPSAAETAEPEPEVLSADNILPSTDKPRVPPTKPAPEAARPAAPQPVLSADNTPEQTPTSAPTATARSTNNSPAPSAAIPHQGNPTDAALPWTDLDAVADVLFANLQPDELDELAQLIADRLTSRTS